MQSLRVNGERLWSTVMETALFGGTPGGGITRLTLSDEDREAGDWFVSRCMAIVSTVTVDQVGNTFARRARFEDTRQPIAFGSRLDTQPSGGKFDGVAGVLVGLEMLRTLDEKHITTTAPLELINWTNEEGSRFAPTMIASGAFAGIYTTEYAQGLKDRQGRTFRGELERIGYRRLRRSVSVRDDGATEPEDESSVASSESGTRVKTRTAYVHLGTPHLSSQHQS